VNWRQQGVWLLACLLMLARAAYAEPAAMLAGVWPPTPAESTAIMDKKTPIDRYGRAEIIVNQEQLLGQGKVVMNGTVANPNWQRAERDARRAKRGLWTTLPILTPDNASEHSGEFALVAGRVKSFYRSYDDLYLNFGADWKTDFTLRIPRREWKKFPTAETLVGKNIEARGILHDRNGPMITVLSPGQIEELP
jgi:micrococcal nuclease